MELTELTVEELYAEIADVARDQGTADQEGWDEVVEEVVESHLAMGEIDVDEDTEGMKEILKMKWSEYKRENVEEELGQQEDVSEDLLDENNDDMGLGQTKDEEEMM